MKNHLAILIFLLLAAFAPQALMADTNRDFAASQQARADGVAAFRAGDLKTALIHMETALSLRPSNPLLLGNIAYLAATTGDPARAAQAADHYAAEGLVPAPEIQAALKNALDAGTWAALDARFTRNALPMGHVSPVAVIPEEIRLVEGVAVGPEGSLYLSTVVSRALYRRMPDGTLSKLLDGKDHGIGSFFGLAFRAGTGLYATYGTIAQTPGMAAGTGQTGVLLIDPDTGRIVKNWALPDSSANHQIADICLSTDGALHVSDAAGKAVYRLDGDTLAPAFQNEGFMSPQGLAEMADGALILADYGRGLWYLDPMTGTSTLIEPGAHQSLIGIDGLSWHQGQLIAIQNGTSPQRLIGIELSTDKMRVTKITVLAQSLAQFDEPTLGVSTPDGFIFVGASGWPYYGEGGTRDPAGDGKGALILKLQD